MFRLGFDARRRALRPIVRRGVQQVASGDNHIVVSGLHCKPGRKSHGLFQAPAHPVAFDCVAVLLGDGEADAGFGVGLLAVENFEQEERPLRFSPSRTARNCGRLFSRPTVDFRYWTSCRPPSFYRARSGLSRQTLAAAGPAGNDDLAATLGGDACTEAVTALANKLGRLVGTLRHLF